MNKPRTTHTSFFKGSKIRVIFRDGAVVIGKFIEKLNRKAIRVELASGATEDFLIRDIRSANYYKPLPHEL